MAGQLSGRTALVTGAAGGIGAAIVARFGEEGARVAGLDVVPGSGGEVSAIADMASDVDLARAYAMVSQAIGAPDILVHAAAASVPGGCLDTDTEDWARLYDINVIGAVRLMRLAVPAMRAGTGGAIILLSSINADFATPTLAAYAATKAALNNLTKTAALELAPHAIRVNAIAPASIDTPLLRASFDLTGDAVAARAANIKRHPLGRIGSADEVADLAVFLASNRAAWITGAVHHIDGGAHVTRR